MNSRQRIGLAVGGGIIAVAAAVGVGVIAANLAGGGNAQGSPGYTQGAGGQEGQGRRGFDTTTLAKQLATKLGVDEAKVKTALDNAMQANQPSGRASGNPSGGMPGGQGMPSGGMPGGGSPGAAPSGGASGMPGGGNNTMLIAIAKSMATELNLDQAKVLAALQEVWPSSGGPGGQASAQPSAQPTK